jgi:hypothetical protein
MQPSAGPDHPPGQTVMSATSLRGRMQANRPRRSGYDGPGLVAAVKAVMLGQQPPVRSRGFRRCQAPHCRVSRTKTVWPSEYRVAVPIWGRVHLACRPTPSQLRMLRMTAAIRRVTISFQVSVEPMCQAIAAIQRMMAGLTVDPDLWQHQADRWHDGITFEDH